jgi:predicted nucleic acid-binding protein
MILVVDTNILIAALVRDSKTREMIMTGKVRLVSPDFVKTEIYKYENYIIKKAKMSKKEIDILIELLFENIEIIAEEEYKTKLNIAAQIMQEDKKDIPYVACYLALNCDGIWTNDEHYNDKPKLKVFKTEHLLDIM